MFSGNWLCVVAVRGFLIGAILLTAGVSFSADVTQKPTAETNQSQKATQDKGATQPLVVPNEKQESPTENKATDDKADYYTKADLDAQERMAAEAERLAKLTDSQLTVAIVGAVLLVFTLIAAGVAAAAAWSAARSGKEIVTVTSDSAERQLRAYVTIIEATMGKPGTLHVFIVFKNAGQTPAYHLICAQDWNAGDETEFEEGDMSVATSSIDLGPGATTTVRVPISFTDAKTRDDLMDREIPFYVWGRSEYIDAFQRKRHISFRYTLPQRGDGIDLTSMDLIACSEGNDSN